MRQWPDVVSGFKAYRTLQSLSKDIFRPQIQIERKRSKEYLIKILAVKRKLWLIFLPQVHLQK